MEITQILFSAAITITTIILTVVGIQLILVLKDIRTLVVKINRIENTQIALSPDSRWLAFTSDRSGRSEVYVASFPDMQVKYPVSQGGGSEPRWAHSGRELFFKIGSTLR